MFRRGVELSQFVSSIHIIQEAYQAILDTTLSYELHTNCRSGIDVLALTCSPDYTTRFLEGKFDLVPSENVDFISTKVNSSFSINKVAVELFQNLGAHKYIVDYHWIGSWGYLAILSTLRLQHAIDVKESNGSKETKRPICITFGSPLVGDVALQSAIAERPQWKFSFLNVVTNKDLVASSFTSNTPYKTLGTFLFCTESGGHATFEDEDSILPVLDAMKSQNSGSLQFYDYTNVLTLIRRKVLYRGAFELGESNLNLLRAGITLQLREVCVLDDISNDQIEKMEKKHKDLIKRKNAKDSYEHVKKLSERKIS